jgi:hypothetical protein
MCLGGHCFLDSGGARGGSPDSRGKVFVLCHFPIILCRLSGGVPTKFHTLINLG